MTPAVFELFVEVVHTKGEYTDFSSCFRFAHLLHSHLGSEHPGEPFTGTIFLGHCFRVPGHMQLGLPTGQGALPSIFLISSLSAFFLLLAFLHSEAAFCASFRISLSLRALNDLTLLLSANDTVARTTSPGINLSVRPSLAFLNSFET
jgi:hypothetical protein